MKVKLFTHTDLDGIGCAILGKLAFEENIDIEYCNYNDVNEKIGNFYEGSDKNNYDLVFITDLSVNEDVANIINHYTPYPKTFLLDHHMTALWLNKYSWADVTEETILIHMQGEEEITEKVSGTYLFLIELLSSSYITPSREEFDVLKEFADTVRKYDCWLWKTKYNDNEPKKWNDLLYILGRDKFIERVIRQLSYLKFEITDEDIFLLELEQEKIDKYVEKKNKEIITKEILGYKAGIIFGEQYHSEVGNRLAELHPELDFIVIINASQAVSYRSIGNKVHLGEEIAKFYGGGGHMNAAGSQIDSVVRERITEILFDGF